MRDENARLRLFVEIKDAGRSDAGPQAGAGDGQRFEAASILTGQSFKAILETAQATP